MKDRSENEGLAALFGAPSREPELFGLRTNLYMVFMTNTWRRAGQAGVVGLLHPESHFVDPKAGSLRASAYHRLRRHWQFSNELFLFADVHHVTEFGVHVYGEPQPAHFLQAVNILSPATVDRSLDHNGEGDAPSIQFPEGGWDTRPHKSRIVVVDEIVLENWVRLFDEPGTPAIESRLLRPLTTADLGALSTYANQPVRLGGTNRFWTVGFNEKLQKVDGTFEWRTEVPSSLADCILQGPHILNATPFAQQPRPDCKNNTDWEAVDLETLPAGFVPRTNYQRLVDRGEFIRRQTIWGGEPFTASYREAHREFVNSSHERTIKACILPPGPPVVGSIVNISLPNHQQLVRWTGLLSSLPYDYLVKVSGVGHIKQYMTDALPIPDLNTEIDRALTLRTLRLNCVTAKYAPLWSELFDKSWENDRFVAANDPTIELGHITSEWSIATPLRTDYERWLALCEIDAIVALLLGLTEDQLIQMYRSQFAVLRKYEYVMVFDGNSRQICDIHQAYGFRQAQWEADLKGTSLKRGEERVGMWDRVQAYRAGDTSIDLGSFIPPFRPADREAAMGRAYRAFSERLAEES